MNEQWKDLKETIIELRDNDGTGTQQEVCKFLANLMDVLEKQITDGWIPVSERLPKELEPCCRCTHKKVCEATRCLDEIKYTVRHLKYPIFNVKVECTEFYIEEESDNNDNK